MISYSTNFEDVMLNRVFRDVADGTYIDVGAFKAEQDSNTYALYARGWSGIVCDPIFAFESAWVRQWRMLRPRDKVVRDAIGAEVGQTTFYMCNFRGLSTCNRAIVDRHVAAHSSNTVTGGSPVSMVTLDRVIERACDGKAPDLVCIDVEGGEGDVLKGIDLAKHRPKLFVIEAYNSGDLTPHYHDWEQLLFDQGYVCAWDDRVNRWYVEAAFARNLNGAFDFPPNVTDDFLPFKQYELQRRLEDYEANRATLAS